MQDTVITTAMNYTAIGHEVANTAKPSNDLQYTIFMVGLVIVVIAVLAVYMFVRAWKQNKTIDTAAKTVAKCGGCAEIDTIRPILSQILSNQEESKVEKRETRKDIKDLHGKLDNHIQWHLNSTSVVSSQGVSHL